MHHFTIIVAMDILLRYIYQFCANTSIYSDWSIQFKNNQHGSAVSRLKLGKAENFNLAQARGC